MSHVITCDSHPPPLAANSAAGVLPDRLPRRLPLSVVTSETSAGSVVEPAGELDLTLVVVGVWNLLPKAPPEVSGHDD